MFSEYEIGELVKRKNHNRLGRVIDKNSSHVGYYHRKRKILVGWKVRYRGKLFIQTQWLRYDQVEKYNKLKLLKIA